MEAAKIWGFDHYDKLDSITITLSHADAAAAVMGGAPRSIRILPVRRSTTMSWRSPASIKCSSPTTLVGGKHTNGTLVATKKFPRRQSENLRRVVAAFNDANAFIKAHPREPRRFT